MKNIKFIFALFLFVSNSIPAFSQQKQITKKENVVYGMLSGTALLMDVYTPQQSNNRGIVFIPGSAWGFGYALDYNQVPLKDDYFLDTSYMGKWGKELVENGYTLFVINHRFTPKYQYQDIIEDCRRAVRFIRYNAKQFAIDPNKLGAMGHSSGANLGSLLGVLDDQKTESTSAIDSVSSRVQAVIALASPFNLADINQPQDTALANDFLMTVVKAYMNELPIGNGQADQLSASFKAASPIAHVTSDDAPTLIYYSDNDPLIAVRQANTMYAALQQNKVPSKMVEVHNAEHNPTPNMKEVLNWLKMYLK